MSACVNLLLALLACTVISTTAVAAANRPGDTWVYYHFDGIGFKAGPSPDDKPFVAVREGGRPVVLLTQTPKIESIDLPEGSGAISGICYIQSSGGKLGGGSGYEACPRVPLVVSSGGKPLVTVQTDEHGYFVVVLPAGTYSIGSGPFAAEIPVERSITSLVPLRAGKRMVD
ncbi:MAG: hypothetical protein H7Y05_01450 [Steroidobacteraceae bacterium]|nr:hypothetical protein [Deltaproteobacteria bacterium]